MSLFDIKGITIVTADMLAKSGGITAKGKALAGQANTREALHKLLQQLAPDSVLKYYTNGAWSMHQMLDYLLQIIGPAELVMSTWTITEDPARTLLNLKQSGQITAIHALFDYRVRERSAGAHQILSSICDSLALGKCHAKVTVLTNDQWSVSIVGSANFSRNRRMEAGTIFTDKEAVLFDRKMILNEIAACRK